MSRGWVALLVGALACSGERDAPSGEVDWAELANARGPDVDATPGAVTPSATKGGNAGPATAAGDPGGDASVSTTAKRDASLDARPPDAAYSERFAAEYRAQLEHDVRELEQAIAARRGKLPDGAPIDTKEKMLRERDEADRARLARRPYLSRISDEEIADFLSYNPQLASSEEELARIVRGHGESIPICADHARFRSARQELEAAMIEYRRCMTLAGVSEQQMRYFNLQITALQNEMRPRE